jgi:hypothetical protein
MDWKTDRDRLRAEIRKASKAGGMKATMLYVLISHMRGKIHMKWYNKYHGGWRPWSKDAPKKGEAPADIKAAYGDLAQKYYEWSAIETLEDQKEFIRKHLSFYSENDKLFELANRVIDGYIREDECSHSQEERQQA